MVCHEIYIFIYLNYNFNHKSIREEKGFSLASDFIGVLDCVLLKKLRWGCATSDVLRKHPQMGKEIGEARKGRSQK